MLIHTHLREPGILHPQHRCCQAITNVAQGTGFHVIESFPDFRSRSARELWVGPFDDHPNALGHDALAYLLVRGPEKLPNTRRQRRSRLRMRRDGHVDRMISASAVLARSQIAELS